MDRFWTDSLYNLAIDIARRIANGESITRSEADAFAAKVLTSEPIRRATALVNAPDEYLHSRLLELLEVVLSLPEKEGGRDTLVSDFSKLEKTKK